MNIQEREQLTRFLEQLTQAPAVQKDAEAEALIGNACIRQPDAAYLLVQRALLLDQAMQNLQTQAARLQGELDRIQYQSGTDNSNSRFPDPNAWGRAPTSRPTSIPQAQTNAVQPTIAGPAASAWGSSMLGNMATTAVGVVAGGFLFQGIEHLLGSHRSNSGFMSDPGTGLPVERPEVAMRRPSDDGEAGSGLFDTSAVDSFIANDSDSNP